ncbi:MAG: hypothetical protein JJE21_07970 [Spirochaetaceae bacterium]|nr:hypothetical protein [Spirochaetaceae bacterium]
MSQYMLLNIEEREKILSIGVNQLEVRAITEKIRRSPCTVSHELTRNSTTGAYSPTLAQKRAEEQHKVA